MKPLLTRALTATAVAAASLIGLAAPASADAGLSAVVDYEATCANAPTPMKIIVSNTGSDPARVRVLAWTGAETPAMNSVFPTIAPGGSFTDSFPLGFLPKDSHVVAYNEDTGVTFFDWVMPRDCRPPATIIGGVLTDNCRLSVFLAQSISRNVIPNPTRLIVYTAASSTPLYDRTVTPTYPGMYINDIPFSFATTYHVIAYETLRGTTVLDRVVTTCSSSQVV